MKISNKCFIDCPAEDETDTNVDKVRKITKKINKQMMKDKEMGPVLLGKIKSQGVRELDDSGLIPLELPTPLTLQLGIRMHRHKKQIHNSSMEALHGCLRLY